MSSIINISPYVMPGIVKIMPLREYTNTEMVQRILTLVTNFYGVSEYQLKGRRRFKAINRARQMAMLLIRENTTLSLKATSSIFGRDHSLVIHAKQLIYDLMSVYPDVKKEYECLTLKITKNDETNINTNH